MAEFAQAASDCGLYEEAVGYFKEAVALRRRRVDLPGIDDQALSVWHQQLAHAYSQLGRTVEAVEAAGGAIVCWSSRHEQRRGAVDSLRNALSASRDLDAYVKHRDTEAAHTGQDSPLIRKTLGEVYRDRGDYERAVVQFQIAGELQPFDREICQALIACYDALMHPQDALKQLLRKLISIAMI
ncbi:MAG: tetratricopeptide repeat protein [Pirellulales bacterium]